MTKKATLAITGLVAAAVVWALFVTTWNVKHADYSHCRRVADAIRGSRDGRAAGGVVGRFGFVAERRGSQLVTVCEPPLDRSLAPFPLFPYYPVKAIEIDASLDERDRVSRVVTNDVLVWLRRP